MNACKALARQRYAEPQSGQDNEPANLRRSGRTQRGLTPRSTGPATARHLGPACASGNIVAVRAKAPCLHGPVSSNVRRHTPLMLRSIFASPIVALATLLICSAAVAQQRGRIESHCNPAEFAYLNAHMSQIHYRNGGYQLIKTGKTLSICTDRETEPFQSVIYRFGPVGAIEMERVATQSSKFRIFERSTSPHTGERIFFFTAGPYTYCVTEVTAQGSGVGLTVLKSGQRVLNLFSGNDRGVDFESELIGIKFSSSISPALQHFAPSNRFKTPCDQAPAK